MASKRRNGDAFGLWLDMTMSDSGMKNRDLAQLVGVHDSVITRWRSGANRPTVHNCVVLARVLNVDPLRLAATAGLLDGEMGVRPFHPPPPKLRRERARAQIAAIKELTEYSRQKLLETYDSLRENEDA